MTAMRAARPDVALRERIDLHAGEGAAVADRGAFAVSAAPSGAPVGHALTLLVRVRPGHKQALVDYLIATDANLRNTPDICVERLRTVHFLRWVVLDDPDDADGGTLLFESNYDGALEEHVAELVREGAACVHRVYRHCAGYPVVSDVLGPADFAAVRTFLLDHAVPYAAFHVGNRGRSAARIRLEAEARSLIQDFLDRQQDDTAWRAASPAEQHAAIVELVERRGLLRRLREPAEPPPVESNLAWIARIAAIAIPLLPLLGPAALVLLIKEITDVPATYRATPEWVRKLAEREDLHVQNQLTHVVDVKPGLLRRWLLRGVLYAIDLLARYRYNQGSLGGITTIHFARWVLVDGGRRLVFFSNYDGSWESYLGDFVDKAHAGLTSVWSNTVGFPKTTLLAFRGATDEDRFKEWTRNHQVPTLLWYSAYRDLTVRNIHHNAAICAGLVAKPASDEALRAWLLSL